MSTTTERRAEGRGRGGSGEKRGEGRSKKQEAKERARLQEIADHGNPLLTRRKTRTVAETTAGHEEGVLRKNL